MVGAEQDRGAVLQAGLAQRAQHLPDPLVQIADGRVVAVAGAADLLGGQPGLVHLAHRAQPPAVGVDLVERQRRDRRVIDVIAPIAIPEALRYLPRIVGIGERDEEEVRLAGAMAGDLIQLARRLEGDLVVVVGLHAGGADPRREHALHRVVPGQRVLERATPVRRPVHVGGIDVGGEPILEPVQLIGADEVHLAAHRGVVARGAQGVHHRGRARPELGGVVVDPGARGVAAGEHGRARRGAERERGVGRLEHRPGLGERRQMRSLDHGMAVGGQPAGGQLVGHEDQERVGRACGHGLAEDKHPSARPPRTQLVAPPAASPERPLTWAGR